ncbi:MAG: hypothetical protein HQK59_10445, partial [Deltaproteobacteria bacterium]|nr:hypothetical protein [Deltaproteobacteria bacterium]
MRNYTINNKFGLSVFVGALFIIAMVLSPQTGIAADPVQLPANAPTSLQELLQQQNDLNQSGKDGALKSAPKRGPRALSVPNGKKQLEPCTAVLDD